MAETLAPQMLAVHIAILSLAVVTIFMRLIVRGRMTEKGLGLDDYVIFCGARIFDRILYG